MGRRNFRFRSRSGFRSKSRLSLLSSSRSLSCWLRILIHDDLNSIFFLSWSPLALRFLNYRTIRRTAFLRLLVHSLFLSHRTLSSTNGRWILYVSRLCHLVRRIRSPAIGGHPICNSLLFRVICSYICLTIRYLFVRNFLCNHVHILLPASCIFVKIHSPRVFIEALCR